MRSSNSQFSTGTESKDLEYGSSISWIRGSRQLSSLSLTVATIILKVRIGAGDAANTAAINTELVKMYWLAET